MLKDYRESFADDLRDPESPREYLAAAYEEGADGMIRAQREIAPAADGARPSRYRSLTEGGDVSLNAVQTALQTLGLDFAIVRAAPLLFLLPNRDAVRLVTTDKQGLLVMVASLQEVNPITTYQVNEAMLLSNTPRSGVCSKILERFWLSDTVKRVFHDRFDKGYDTKCPDIRKLCHRCFHCLSC